MDKLPINIVDLAVFAILLISALLAMFRGFVGLVLATASWVAAVLATYFLFGQTLPIAKEYIQSEIFAAIAAGAAIFLPTLVFCSLLTHLISERVKSSAVSAIDRSLGFVLGLARGALIVVALFWVTDLFILKPAAQPGWYTEARTRPLAVEAYTWLQARLMDQLSGRPNTETKTEPGARPTPVPNRTPIGASGSGGSTDSGRESGYKTEERKGIESLIRNPDRSQDSSRDKQ
ncbi:CvpA family protein [Ferrovibrio sp.]|uniref:CvpA family protein n=1 Tax=Ferrovibrio sp. TaxID=1917215 RepID=UPI0035B17B30